MALSPLLCRRAVEAEQVKRRPWLRSSPSSSAPSHLLAPSDRSVTERLELWEHSQSLAFLGAGSSIRKHTCSKKLMLQKGIRQCEQQEKIRGHLQL